MITTVVQASQRKYISLGESMPVFIKLIKRRWKGKRKRKDEVEERWHTREEGEWKWEVSWRVIEEGERDERIEEERERWGEGIQIIEATMGVYLSPLCFPPSCPRRSRGATRWWEEDGEEQEDNAREKTGHSLAYIRARPCDALSLSPLLPFLISPHISVLCSLPLSLSISHILH